MDISHMDTTQLVIAAVVILAVVAAAVLATVWLMRRRTTQGLRDRFGNEYDRALEAEGNRRAAEARLQRRTARVAKYDIRPLAAEVRNRYLKSWKDVQAEFVESPDNAIEHADALVADVMATEGYPMGDFERRAADLSVDHPAVVENYRAAHDIAEKHRRGDAGTEDLRQAMLYYRKLFTELVSAEPDAQAVTM